MMIKKIAIGVLLLNSILPTLMAPAGNYQFYGKET